MLDVLTVGILLVNQASCVTKSQVGVGHSYRPAEIPVVSYRPRIHLQWETVYLKASILCSIVCSQTSWCTTYRFIEPSSCEMSTFYVAPFYKDDGVQNTIKVMTAHMPDYSASIVNVYDKPDIPQLNGWKLVDQLFPKTGIDAFLSKPGENYALNFELDEAKYVSYIGVWRPQNNMIQLYTGLELAGTDPLDFSGFDLAGPACPKIFCEVRYNPPRRLRFVGIRIDVDLTYLHHVIIA